MLTNLLLQNIILIDYAEISFIEGLNVISGETGSGKSALMKALAQIVGERGDSQIVRHGADKGIIEAVFNIDGHSELKNFLDMSGISVDEDQLIIRREISSNGRSRILINHHNAQLTLLKSIGHHLLEIIGQHANQKLFELDHHRNIVDIFGDLTDECNNFAKKWEEENKLKKEHENLINSESQRLREIEICRMELDELDGADVKEDEEEALFSEYSRLSNAEEIAKKALEIHTTLQGEDQPIIPILTQLKKTLEELTNLDKSLKDQLDSFQSAIIEIDEVANSIGCYAGAIEYDPIRLEEVNDRLTLLNKLKKKYGPTIDDVIKYHKAANDKLSQLERADHQIDELTNELETISKQNQKAATQLSMRRRKVGQQLEKALSEQLNDLNMSKAQFFVEISPQKRTKYGDDKIEFTFAPNVGEKKIPIRDSASGGELSRVMLALQALLMGKEQTPTIVFDEIDANIGGETAAVVGKKLQDVGVQHQILCITHFPQVAKYAKHHLQISKHEVNGRTITQIEVLDDSNRHVELNRMSGMTCNV